jgi:hypothetical protein
VVSTPTVSLTRRAFPQLGSPTQPPLDERPRPGEFGDAPNRYASARARKNYATTSPVTLASGKLRLAMARRGGNRRLGDVCRRWAFGAVQVSPGARAYYESLRARQKTHGQALRAVANRLAAILTCLPDQEGCV